MVTRAQGYLAFLAAWLAATFSLTSIPNPDFGFSFPGADKVAHLALYGVGGFLFALWRRETGRDRAAAIRLAVVFVALLGAADEIHQRWIPGRSMDFLDWLADLSGGTAGALFSSAAVNLFPFLLSGGNRPVSRGLTD